MFFIDEGILPKLIRFSIFQNIVWIGTVFLSCVARIARISIVCSVAMVASTPTPYININQASICEVWAWQFMFNRINIFLIFLDNNQDFINVFALFFLLALDIINITLNDCNIFINWMCQLNSFFARTTGRRTFFLFTTTIISRSIITSTILFITYHWTMAFLFTI